MRPSRALADKSYSLEATWYEEIRDRLPIPQPKIYWTGCESPADPTAEMGMHSHWRATVISRTLSLHRCWTRLLKAEGGAAGWQPGRPATPACCWGAAE